MKNKLADISNKIKRLIISFTPFFLTIRVYADKKDNVLSSDADEKFTLIINTIASYGFKFGLLIIFYGAIQIGLAFKNDNPDGKVQGGRTAIAGLIVAAVSAGANQFF